jgi:serine/threonine protein kinase
MDALRSQDNLPVMLKRVLPEEGPYELSISRRFSSVELVGDRRNHCVPLLDVIELDGHRLMVFPLLRPFNRPRFQTFGEFVAFFTQICEVARIHLPCIMLILKRLLVQGIQFMHERNVAHRYLPFICWE